MILGANSLGRTALAILQQHGRVVYGFLDEDPALHGQEIDHVPVLGSTTEERYLDLIGEDCEFFVPAAHQGKQQQLLSQLKEQKQVTPINVIHASAVIAKSVALGYGNLLNAYVSLDIDATLGSHCVLHTQVLLEHNVVVKDFVQIGAGSVVGAGAILNEYVFVGAGATIVAGVEIGAKASIGAGSVVLRNVEPGEVVLGNPAQTVKIK